MAGLDDAGFSGWVGGLLTNWGRLAAELLLSPGSPYSLAAIAICTALAAFATLSGRRRKRSVPVKVLLRAIFPRRIVRSRSGRADLAFTFFNIFVWAALFGWAVFSASEIGRLVQQGLSSLLGAPSPAPLPGFLCAALMTGALYVAYEFGYWLDHYLAHKIPLLWHFHKVHHSAESLSPITVFRVHPVDTLVYYNILAVVMGGTQGLVGFALGTPTGVLALGGTNILLLATGILLVQLQHSHLWISFSGRLGHILLSPAHHQIHHSADPAHYDRNFGSSLALFDRLFGTLHVPARKREQLRFGVPELRYDPHTLQGGFVRPFMDVTASLKTRIAGKLIIGTETEHAR